MEHTFWSRWQAINKTNSKLYVKLQVTSAKEKKKYQGWKMGVPAMWMGLQF